MKGNPAGIIVRPHTDDILVVDGRSPDGTADVARSLGARVVYDHGLGKGEAIRTVIGHLKRDIVVFIDADGSHDPADIPALVAPILAGQADHVSGSRLIGGSSDCTAASTSASAYGRLPASRPASTTVSRRPVRQNGFRRSDRSFATWVGGHHHDRTGDDIKTLKKGYRMGEVPTHEHRRKAGYSKITVRKVAFRYVYSMVKYLYF